MLRFIFAAGLAILPVSAFSASDHCEGDFCFQKKARTSCLKPGVWDMLHKVSARIGRLEITSACDGKHAHHSYHYKGLAVDFRPLDSSVRTAVAVLHSMPEVGGIGTYSNGLLHADIRTYRVAWHHYRAPRVRYAKARRSIVALRSARSQIRQAYAQAAYRQAYAQAAYRRAYRLAYVRGAYMGTSSAGSR